MEKYRNAHIWLALAFFIALIGFARGYWLNFTNALWDWHLHGITATAWYLLVVIQPYLATRGKLKQHRYLGMLGLILAGGVALSALNVIDGNIKGAHGETGPIATETFLYGVSLVDFISVVGFLISVVMAIRKVKVVDDHAMWMISTVLWAFMPAFGRLALLIMFMTGMVGDNSFVEILAMTTPVVFIIIAIISWRMKRLHPAMVFVGIGNLFYFFIAPVGNSEWWRSLADSIFKYN